MSENSIQLVIFDCDGVLIDSEHISAAVLIRELQAIGIDIEYEYVIMNFLGRSFPVVAAEIRDRFDARLPCGFEDHYRSRLLDEFTNSLSVTEGVRDVLQNLSVKSCVATSSSPERVDRSLQLVELKDFFGPHVFTASEVDNGKPAPDLFLHAAKKMQVRPENCLVIEDSIYGVQAAINAGMDVARYLGGSQYKESMPVNDTEQLLVPVFADWSAFYSLRPELDK